MTTATSSHNLHLGYTNFVIAPPVDQTITNFNSTWTQPTDPSSPNYVNPRSSSATVFSATPVAGDIAVGPALVNGGVTGFNYYDPKGYYAAGHDPATAQAAYLANPSAALIPIYSYISNVSGSLNSATQADNPANYIGWSKEQVTWLRASNPSEFASLVTSGSRARLRDISQGLTWQGHFLDGDLVPTYGSRKDHVTAYNTAAYQDPVTGIAPVDYQDDLSSRTDVAGTSHTWGFVYHLPKRLTDRLPWGSGLSIFYDHGNNFKSDTQRRDLDGNPIANPRGLTKEYGFTFTTLHDKLSLKVDHFKTEEFNATLSSTNGNDIAGLGDSGFFLADGLVWGYGWATALQDFITGRTPTSSYGDYAVNDGFVRSSAATVAAANDYNLNGGTSPNGTKFVGGLAISNAWVKLPLPASYFTSFNLTPALNPALGEASGNLRDSYIGGPNDASNANPGGGSPPFGNHQITVDNLSKGIEIELTAQPVKNWNITVNYSHVKATHANIDATAQQFIGTVTKFMNGPGGQVREWYNGGQGVGVDWNNNIVAPFTVELDSLGHEAPEISPWRLNLVTTYNFDRGVAKGFFVGTGLNIDSGRIIGYNYDANYQNVNSNDPNYAAVAAVTNGGLNVDDPIRGKNERHVNGWIGYSKKIRQKLNWRVQLNLTHIGEQDHLIAAQDNPGDRAVGIAPSIALARISEGMAWQLTNTIEF